MLSVLFKASYEYRSRGFFNFTCETRFVGVAFRGNGTLKGRCCWCFSCHTIETEGKKEKDRGNGEGRGEKRDGKEGAQKIEGDRSRSRGRETEEWRGRGRERERENSRGKGGLAGVNATGWHYAARPSMHIEHIPMMIGYNRDIVRSKTRARGGGRGGGTFQALEGISCCATTRPATTTRTALAHLPLPESPDTIVPILAFSTPPRLLPSQPPSV